MKSLPLPKVLGIYRRGRRQADLPGGGGDPVRRQDGPQDRAARGRAPRGAPPRDGLEVSPLDDETLRNLKE